MKKYDENVVTRNFGGGIEEIEVLRPYEMRSAVEEVLNQADGMSVTGTEGSTLFVECGGAEWAVDCMTVDTFRESEVLYMMHLTSESDEDFLLAYKKWKAYIRKHRTELGEEVPARFKQYG